MRVPLVPHQPQMGAPHTFDVGQAQKRVERWVAELYKRAPFLDGVLLEGVSLATGVNDVPHSLGRALRGWWVTRFPGAAAASYPADGQSDSDHPGTDRFLRLYADMDRTVDLWVW